jgi:transcription termination factor 2
MPHWAAFIPAIIAKPQNHTKTLNKSGLNKSDARSFGMKDMQWFINQEHRDDLCVHGGIVADEMGMGKTATMCNLIRMSNIMAPTLVVVPKSVVWQWIETLNDILTEPDAFIVHTALSHESLKILLEYCFDGDKQTNIKQVVVTTYDCIRLVDKQQRKRLAWGRIIVDEAHCIKNKKTQLHKCLAKLRAHAKWALSATPIHKSKLDLLALASFIGVETDDEQLVIGSYMIRRLPDATDRPAYTVSNVILQPNSAWESEVIARAEAERMEHSQNEKNNNKNAMMRQMWCLQANTHVAMYLSSMADRTPDAEQALDMLQSAQRAERTVKSSKFAYLLSDIQSHDAKCIVFYQWKKECSLLQEMFMRQNINTLCFNGSQSMQERMDVIRFFQSAKDQRILLAQVKCAACGLNLQCASRVYLMRPFWNPALEAQAIGRVYRRGQTNDVVVKRLVMQGTVDEECMTQQEEKVANVSEILHDSYMKDLLHGMKI